MKGIEKNKFSDVKRGKHNTSGLNEMVYNFQNNGKQ